MFREFFRAPVKLAPDETPVRGLTWLEAFERRDLDLRPCSRCGLYWPSGLFRVNRAVKSGFDSWCRSCHVNANRRWRAENRERVNAARRIGPFPTTCRECGRTFDASTR